MPQYSACGDGIKSSSNVVKQKWPKLFQLRKFLKEVIEQKVRNSKFRIFGLPDSKKTTEDAWKDWGTEVCPRTVSRLILLFIVTREGN